MLDRAETSQVESGIVESFAGRGFGFITLDSGEPNLFFHVVELLKAGFESISPGTRVMFHRGPGKDGRPRVARFIEIAGRPVVEYQFHKVGKRYEIVRELTRPITSARDSASSKTAERNSEASVPLKPVRVVPEDWIDVNVRKIRKERVTYARTESLGQVEIPWELLQKVHITSLREGEGLQVKVQEGEEHLIATAVRRR